MASKAKCMAAVQELTAIACFAPTTAANSASNWRVLGPVVTQPEVSASLICCNSASPTSGRAKGRKVDRMFIKFYWDESGLISFLS